MRTFLSHDATARCSDCGEKAKSEIPSSGGLLSAISFEISPVVLFALVVVVVDALPNRPDIAAMDVRTRGRGKDVERQIGRSWITYRKTCVRLEIKDHLSRQSNT